MSEKSQGKNKFFKVREFWKVSEYFKFVKICHGFVREFSNLVVSQFIFFFQRLRQFLHY